MANRKRPQPVLTRRERMEREAERSKQRRKQTLLWLGGGIVLLGLIIAGFVLLSGVGQPVPGEKVASAGASHVPMGTPINYEHIPPSSGTHYPQTAQYGVYEEPIVEGLWLHNLEHGAIVVLYNCPEGCPDLVEQLRQAYQTFPPSARFGTVKLVVTPYPKLQTRLAYLAWEYEYLTDTYQRDELFRFYQAHLDKGPELAQ